jgi:hypothetical protein
MHWRRMQRAPGSVRERVESTGQASDVLAPVRRLISSSFSLSALRKHIFHRPYEKPLKNPSQNFAKEFALSSPAPGARVRRAVSLKAVQTDCRSESPKRCRRRSAEVITGAREAARRDQVTASWSCMCPREPTADLFRSRLLVQSGRSREKHAQA